MTNDKKYTELENVSCERPETACDDTAREPEESKCPWWMWLFLSFLIIMFLGSVASLSVGAYYLDHPDSVQKITLVQYGCTINVTGNVCELYTVPSRWNTTIPCNTYVPPPRLDLLYDCWYTKGKLYLTKPLPPDWPVAPLVIGILGVIVFGISSLAFLCVIIDEATEPQCCD